jgi:hypothetical protein
VAPLAESASLRVRSLRLEDCAAIRALQGQAMPGIPPWTVQQLESQRHVFPDGQLVAEAGGLVVGALGSLIVRWDDYAVGQDWKEITGDGCFTTHDPAGRTLFGLDPIVVVTRRGFGVARALYHAQRRLCRRLNLRRIIAAARLPGYHAVEDRMTPDLYAMKVIWGDLEDPVLRFPLSLGFDYCGIVHGYRPEDAESCGHAALIVWLNPLYAPPRPPAAIERERSRKCA